jgi:phage baseplate assembly protein W
MALTKPLDGFRFVEILQGDTLQKIALRELGDGAQWPLLIAVNDLFPPYLTADPTQVSAHVRLYGDTLVVPATRAQTAGAFEPDLVYGADLALNRGLFDADENGDLLLVAGVSNLKQAYESRLKTPLRELVFHGDYGCGVHGLKGRGGQPGVLTLGAQMVRSALNNDPRTSRVASTRATLSGDADLIEATVIPQAGKALDIGVPF